jgi:hypothetical protein
MRVPSCACPIAGHYLVIRKERFGPRVLAAFTELSGACSYLYGMRTSELLGGVGTRPAAASASAWQIVYVADLVRAIEHAWEVVHPPAAAAAAAAATRSGRST